MIRDGNKWSRIDETEKLESKKNVETSLKERGTEMIERIPRGFKERHVNDAVFKLPRPAGPAHIAIPLREIDLSEGHPSELIARYAYQASQGITYQSQHFILIGYLADQC